MSEEAIILTVAGIILAIFFGDFLAGRWQLRSYRYQRRQDRLERLRQKQEEIITNLSRLIGRRLHIARGYCGALKLRHQERIEFWAGQHTRVLMDWNTQHNYFIVAIRMYFDASLSRHFSDGISVDIAHLSSAVERGRILFDRNEINEEYYEFLNKVITRTYDIAGLSQHLVDDMLLHTGQTASLLEDEFPFEEKYIGKHSRLSLLLALFRFR